MPDRTKDEKTKVADHIHVAGTTIGLPVDKCAVCGRDGLDPIHIRYGTQQARKVRPG